MKIFIVSEAGKIADVTLHTSCTSADQSALKVCCFKRIHRILTPEPQVSTSCTSVYIDGSETRGALNAEVKVKYGTFSGQVSPTLPPPG